MAELQGKTVYSLVQPYSEVLLDTVAPRKHLKLRHYTVQSQIGILDGLEFCSSSQPQLFSLNMSNPDHQNLFQELLPICEGDEAQLYKNVCYKNFSSDLTPLRKSALNALASFYQLLEQREVILSTLHKALASPSTEIQQTAFAALKKFISNTELYSSTVRSSQPSSLENLRPIMQIAAEYLREYLHPLTEYTSLNTNVIQHLSYITQLYPTILNEKFSEYLLSHLKRWLDDVVEVVNENSLTTSSAINSNSGIVSLSALQSKLKPFGNELKLCSAIISLLADLQSAPAKLVDAAISLVLKYERAFMLEVNSSFRAPLSNFLKRFPFETLKFLLHSDRIKDSYNYRFLIYLINTQSAFLQIFKNESQRLIQMLNEANSLMLSAQQLSTSQQQQQQNTQSPADLIAKTHQIQFLTILIVYRLVKQDNEGIWIAAQAQLIESLLRIWVDERFHEKHRNVDQLDQIYWKEPVYLVKILLKFHQVCILHILKFNTNLSENLQ